MSFQDLAVGIGFNSSIENDSRQLVNASGTPFIPWVNWLALVYALLVDPAIRIPQIDPPVADCY